MANVSVRILGAGGEVGRSCFLVTIGSDSVLIDTGVHLSASSTDERIPSVPTDIEIVGIIITHYHLDHIGALPYLLEISELASLRDCDIYMSTPTSLLAPPILADYCRSGPNSDLFTPNHIIRCFQRIRTISLNTETYINRSRNFSFTVFHAGHVLGGVGLLLKHQGTTVVYTGDFSVSEDALLKPVWIPQLTLPAGGTDLVISECTHATRIAERSISVSEKELCSRITSALKRNGKVLIPIFAVGRTQEIASIIRAHLGAGPKLYTTSSSGKNASVITRSVARSWTVNRDLREVVDLDVKLLCDMTNLPSEPCVIFSSPAMIEGGISLELFMQLCTNSRNLVLLTGYCSPDSVGNSVILFASRRVANREVMVHGQRIEVNCECAYIPFSNHSDSPGIESVIRRCVPRNVILVHGDKIKMETFSSKVKVAWARDIDVRIPRNGDTLEYDTHYKRKLRSEVSIPVTIRRKLSARCSDLQQLGHALSKSDKDINITTYVDRIVVAADSVSISLSLVGETSEVVIEYVSDTYHQSTEWICYNRLIVWVKDALSRYVEDNFSISECS